jgi:HEAT repeat protein
MEVVMRWILPVAYFLAFSFSHSLAADERLAREQSAEALIKQLQDKDPEKVCAAAKALRKLGSAAKDASPALKELLKDRNEGVRLNAAEALWVMHHQTNELLPVYSELLGAANADVRAASAWRLGRLDNVPRAAVVLLAGALRDENLEVRVQAGQALANLGANAEAALPALVRALGDGRLDETESRGHGSEGVRTSPALPALVEMADDAIPLLIATFPKGILLQQNDESHGPGSWTVASRAAHAFPAFGARGVQPLLRALESKKVETRGFAALALSETAQLNGLPETAIAALEKCLDDTDKGVRMSATKVMVRLRPSSAKAVARLDQAKRNGDISGVELPADLGRMIPHNPAARDPLFRMLKDADPATAREAYRILGTLHLPVDQAITTWTPALSHADPEVRSEAISALRTLGPAARPALAILRERFTKEKDDEHGCKSGILNALSAIAPDDTGLIPFLLKAMDDPDWFVRRTAIWRLTDFGPRAKAAVPQIEAHMFGPLGKDEKGHPESSQLSILIEALIRIAPDSGPSAEMLLKALRKPAIRSAHDPKNSYFLRDILEDGLQTYMPAAAPMLREALKDKDSEVRQSVALVFVHTGLEIETALSVLMENLWSDDVGWTEKDRFQRRVVKKLMRRQPQATPAVAAAWCKAWQTAGPLGREVLERGLLVLQPEALPHLLDQLQQAESPKTRRDLAHLLARFEGQGNHIASILREELREPGFANQYAAMIALMEIGPDGAEAVPELVRLLGSPKPEVKAVAARTLGRIGRAAQPAVPALRALMKEAMPQIRILAADALSRIDPNVNEALLTLRAEFPRRDDSLLRESDQVKLPDGFKDYAIYLESIPESIARYGERAVSILAELLDNTNLDEWSATNLSAQCGAYERVQAALLLAELGPEATAAVPALTRALKDRDPLIREAAASALARIGPAAKEAAPDLITLLEKKNRFTSTGGPWVPGEFAGRYDYGQPSDFRGAGRQRLLARFPGYSSNYDPYARVRPRHPHVPAYALSRIDGETRSALPILNEMAKNQGNPDRLAAALAVWRSRGLSRELIPAFKEALEAHGSISPKEAIPLSPELRECLAELGTELTPALPAMAAWLKRPGWGHKEEEDRAVVAEAIGRLGAEASPAADLLRTLFHGNRWEAKIRVASAMALFRIGGDKDLVFPVLREILAGREEHTSIYQTVDSTRTARVHAVSGLGVLAENGDERARALVIETAKGDENPNVRVAALEAMARLKQSNPEAIIGLRAMLWHRDAEVRVGAASALGRLGAAAKLSRSALKAATEDSALAVRQAARQSLPLID